jgi:integral membrane protein (TIGR01906 family)
MRQNFLYQLLCGVVTVILPIFLVLTGVRLLITPLFLQIEYSWPNFPADPYGFSKSDRLHWANIDIDYLLNDADISFLADLRFEDGQPVYNQRELQHMVDVKNVVKYALFTWYLTIFLLILTAIWAWWRGWSGLYRVALLRGVYVTFSVIVLIIFFVFFAFNIFFVAFHNIFFAEGTWTFLFSDTLIRLFPQRFWQDAFILVGVCALLLGGLIGLIIRRSFKKKNERIGKS